MQLARGSAGIQIQTLSLPLQYSQSSNMYLCISNDEKHMLKSARPFPFQSSTLTQGFLHSKMKICFPVFCLYLLVQHHRLSQYLKGLNCFFEHVQWLVLETPPDSTLWGQTTLWEVFYQQTPPACQPWGVSHLRSGHSSPSWCWQDHSLAVTWSETWARIIQASCSEFLTHRMGERQ